MSHTLRQYSTAAKCCKILSSRHDMAIVLKKKKITSGMLTCSKPAKDQANQILHRWICHFIPLLTAARYIAGNLTFAV